MGCKVMNLKSLTKYDTDLFYFIYRLTVKRDCRSIIWLSKTGDGYLYFVIGMLLWAFEPEHGELFLYTALMAYALELPIYVLLKKMFKRPRPCDFLMNLTAHVTPSDKFSLPSGHGSRMAYGQYSGALLSALCRIGLLLGLTDRAIKSTAWCSLSF